MVLFVRLFIGSNICVDLFDVDRSGSINLQEFAGLFNYINDWKRMFESVDTDRSGYIEAHELSQGIDTAPVHRSLYLSLS
jgi:Ca2+-binding EF-hand superfamily protein